MADSRHFLQQREQFCRQRLANLQARISEIQELRGLNLSIYVGGSYGRFEASVYSDLDIFFIMDDEDTGGKLAISKIVKTLVDAQIIKIARDLEFPEFSNEGQYLEIHSLYRILNALGGIDDDYHNYFTARLLLLLESKPLFNENAYHRIISAIINAYLRDYHDHAQDFRPVFMINDILRFWRTLCLNYEHKRNRPQRDEIAKRKAHVQNLKLKFSRLMTCFSAIIPLTSMPLATHDTIRELVGDHPIKRLIKLLDNEEERRVILDRVLDKYVWFLEITSREKDEMLEWIGIKGNRSEAFDRAREFSKDMYTFLLKCCSNNECFRYLTM